MPNMQEEAGAPLTAADTTSASTPSPQRHWRALALTAAAVGVVLDQGTKVWALSSLGDGQSRPLIGDLVQLRLIRNAGAAFSFGDGVTWLLTLVAVGISVWVARALWRTTSRIWALTLGVLLGGAIGNLIDRFFRSPGPGRGHVVDFLDYGGLFVGNVADIAIVVAAVVMALLTIAGIPYAAADAVDGQTR